MSSMSGKKRRRDTEDSDSGSEDEASLTITKKILSVLKANMDRALNQQELMKALKLKDPTVRPGEGNRRHKRRHALLEPSCSG